MFKSTCDHLVYCPACSRPVKFRTEMLGHELKCVHCQKLFVNYETTDHRLISAHTRKPSLTPHENHRLSELFESGLRSSTLILVEHRDEVYARLAADIENLEQMKFLVLRAESVSDALLLSDCCHCSLIIVNRNLPGQNGWVLADKLGMYAPDIELWLYMPQPSAVSVELAACLNVSKVIDSSDSLFSLSTELTQQLKHSFSPDRQRLLPALIDS